jgi:hypothetical protein
VLLGWSLAVVSAIDIPGGLHSCYPGPQRAGEVWTFGPGMRPDMPTRVVDMPDVGARVYGALSQIFRGATGAPLRVRMGTPVPQEDGLVLADLSYSPSLADAARIRAEQASSG